MQRCPVHSYQAVTTPRGLHLVLRHTRDTETHHACGRSVLAQFEMLTSSRKVKYSAASAISGSGVGGCYQEEKEKNPSAKETREQRRQATRPPGASQGGSTVLAGEFSASGHLATVCISKICYILKCVITLYYTKYGYLGRILVTWQNT